MSLTALEVKRASCPKSQKLCKKSDGNGLFLLVKNNGSKLWRFRYRFSGTYQELAFGRYPTIPLVEARNMAARARAQLVQGINPAEERRARKRVSTTGERVFGAVALVWWGRQKSSWSADHARKINRWITVDMKPLAKLPVDVIDQGHITELMLSLEASGKRRAAPVILSLINRIFGYALAHRYTRSNPAQGLPLGDVLNPMPKVTHRAAITTSIALGQLIRDIDQTDSGSFCTVEALKLIPRLFLRPKEIRCLKWEYIDFDQKLLVIPAEEMKRSRDHLVPLADQVLEQLQAIQKVTSYSWYVFPSLSNSDKPISKNVMTNRLRSLGYAADVVSAHGFRSTASTILHERGWHHDVIETQLAHLVGTATSRAYNRSEYLAERTRMMQSWADHLDALRDGTDIVAIGARSHG
ncbi:tyrosine-type recombinase/integrase [Spongiibacter marinus]|uniref:tyrosine-type recombinase/integrase n=1 Tax=Spongiibacter marinus TaxID=354246 RepID=UPI0003FA5B66|nr:integrase arm-type DNA-binding domain-containing protein [Spongiibacter marinus]